MAITEPAQARVLRGVPCDGDHAFVPVADLPRVAVARPTATGNSALDAIRAAAWDQGYADGREQGTEVGYAEGVERGRAEGREVGYADGRVSAIADAKVEVRREVEQAVDALVAAADDLARRQTVSLAQIESTVVEMALAVAEAVVQRELAVSADPGRDALVRAFALAPEDGDLIAHLNPVDVESITDLSDLAPGRRIQLVADPGVGRGGALVEVGAARLDARIETAMSRVREVLAR
jgi:flagellar assembly protein FliH